VSVDHLALSAQRVQWARPLQVSHVSGLHVAGTAQCWLLAGPLRYKETQGLPSVLNTQQPGLLLVTAASDWNGVSQQLKSAYKPL
jgi:hypothetical protein